MAIKTPGRKKSKAPLKGTPKTIKPPSPRILYLVMALVAAVILVSGYLFYYFQEQQMRQRIESGLSIVAQLKAEQITEWRTERLQDANILVGSPFFAEGVERYLASPTDTEIKDKILARLAVMEKAYPYQDILLTDVNGSVLLSLNDRVPRLGDMTLSQLAVAIKEHKAVITDFHYPPDSNSPHLDVVAPLFPWQQDSQPIGAVVFSIDPYQYLYPLLQSWPFPSETAEVLLVERDGDQVLFLNELRHQKDTALKSRIPLSQQEVPAVMAVTGKEGVVEGRDYRGVEVLSALKHIPDSPWYMVTKIDTSEALAAWRSRAGMIIAFFTGLLTAALAGIGFIWQRRERLAYQTLYQAELQSQALRGHFEYLVKYANDIILLTDKNYHIVEVNDRALEIYGYTRQEMLGMQLTALVAPEDRSSYQARLRKIQQEGTIVTEAIHQRKNGSTFPVEVSGRTIKIEDKSYFQEILRDITERRRAEEMLKDSEERFRSLVESTSDWIWEVDRNGIYTYTSPKVKELLGYEPEEVIGKTPFDLMPPDEAKRVADEFQNIIATNKPIEGLENTCQHKNGHLVTLETSGVPIFDSNGQLCGYRGVDRDITKRKKMEELVKENESRFRSIVETTREWIWRMDLDGKMTYNNPAFEEILGYNHEELLGRNTLDYMHEDDRLVIEQMLQQLIPEKRGWTNLVVRWRHKDGTLRWLESNAVPILDSEGQMLGYQGADRDITERKKAEEALRESEERYRTILERMEESYYEIDLAGNFTFVNDALCRRLGQSREELIGMNYRAYTPQERADNTFKTFNQVYRTGQPMIAYPAVAMSKDGNLIYSERSIFPLRDEEGKIIGFRGISRDVTQRKLAEEERSQLELKAQITGRLASVGEMAAGVAHEINNPLTAVTGYAQLLMDRKDVPPDIRSDLVAINDGAQRVAGIVQRLLAFSRQTKPERKLVDINELIESTLVLRAYHLRVNNIKVVTRLARGFLETVVDPGQIQQVLLNLIVNAETEMKLAHGKGKLTITTEKRHNTIKICVKDNGPGIKPEVMDKIFDPFFTTREVGQGTGLGLSLCYGIVTGHKGKIYAESRPGKGATFVIELPVLTKAVLTEPAEPVTREPARMGKARILVVDDEPVIRDIVSRVLSGEGHKVDTADNAADALKKIETRKYSLVLLDIKMPGMDGVELYKRIQKINKSLARRVVFITGDAMGADTEKFLAETKSAHIEKPFNAEQLSKKVLRALTIGR